MLTLSIWPSRIWFSGHCGAAGHHPTQEQIDSANSSYADTYGAQRSMLNALQLAVLDKVEESAVLS